MYIVYSKNPMQMSCYKSPTYVAWMKELDEEEALLLSLHASNNARLIQYLKKWWSAEALEVQYLAMWWSIVEETKAMLDYE